MAEKEKIYEIGLKEREITILEQKELVKNAGTLPATMANQSLPDRFRLPIHSGRRGSRWVSDCKQVQ